MITYALNWSRRNLIGTLTFQNMTHIWPKNLAAFGQTTFSPVGCGGLGTRLY